MFTKFGTYSPCGLFNLSHIIASVICFALVLIAVYLVKDLNHQKQCLINNVLSAFVGVMLITDFIYNIVNKGFIIESILPFGVVMAFVLAMICSNAKCKMVKEASLIFMGFVGVSFGAVLLFVPVSSFANFPLFHFKSLFDLIYYSIMLYSGIMVFASKQVELNLKNFKLAMLLVLDLLIDCLTLSLIFNTNFMFLITPSGLHIGCLNSLYLFSESLYTLTMFAVYLALPAIMYMLYALANVLIKKYNND